MVRTVSYELPEYLAERRAARHRERVVQVVALAVAVAALGGAALFIAPMNRMRIEQQMVIDPGTIKGLPPTETLLAKTATLRALAIDWAFIRSERLKEEGKYYEAMQLADWICKLAPRFPSVWAFHAWNQAYNISVGTYTPEERWKWVSNGVRLLRDEGIQYNPKSVALYKQLAMLFWHKIGDYTDDQHWNYKKELAVEFERVLGPPPVVTTAQEAIDNFARIVQAPRDLKGMLAEDAEVADLVRRLRKLELEPDATLLAFVARHVRDDLSVSRYLRSVAEEEARSLEARRVAALSDEQTAEARQRLLAALRSQVLRQRYNMDLDWMLSLMETHGPIDWRSPHAHALYWASWGDMVTRGQINLSPHDSMNTARFILFGLKNMVERGRMVLVPDFDRPNRSYIDLLPDLRFIDPLHQAYLEVSKAQFGDDPNEYREGESAGNYRVGHFNFLADAIRALYFAGDADSLAKAQHYYDYLRRVNRGRHGRPKKMYMGTLEDFALAELKSEIGGFRRTNIYVGGLLRRSLDELAVGRVETSEAAVARAKSIYDYYMTEVPAGDRSNRRKLDKFVVIRRDVIIAYLRDPYVPLLHKARGWEGLDEQARQMAWDACEPFLVELCGRMDPPWDPAKAFPEPPGMDEYRANPVEERRREVQDVSEGTKDYSP